MDFDNRVNDATAPGNLDLDSDAIRTRFDVGFGDGYTASYIGGYAEFDQSQLYGNGVQGDSRNTVYSTYEGTQHELQVTSPSDQRFFWTAGLFYFEEENSIRFDMLHGSWGFTPQDSPDGVLSTFVQPSRGLESESVYGQGTFAFTDRLRLTAGARYIDDTRTDEGGRSIDCTFGLVGDLPANIAAQASDLNGAQGCFFRQYNDMKGNWTKTTWMARGEYDLSEDVLLYLSHGTGWKSGVLQDGMGFADLDDGTGNLDFTRNNALLQEPEEVESTELGVKTDFAGWRLSANLFYMDFTNMQVTGAVIDPVTGQSTLTNTNAGGATIQGVEFESSVALFDSAGRLDFTLRLSRCHLRRVPRQREQFRRRARPHLESLRPRRRAERRLHRQRVRLCRQQPAVCPGIPGDAHLYAHLRARQCAEHRAAYPRQLFRRHVPGLGESHRSPGWHLEPDRPGRELTSACSRRTRCST